ncbi:MAG: hypothetical protein N2439_04525 [Anaerolineae bacterium]|nr:hypothetical protein [Anaerolineae bacterium]
MSGVLCRCSLWAAVVIVLLVASACVLPPPPVEPTAAVEAPTAPPPTVPAPPALTLDQLQNGVYRVDAAPGGKVTLANGRFETATGAGATQKITVALAEQIASGDLNGDGLFDAAVILATNTGGTGVFKDLHVVLNRAGQAVDAAAMPLGDRVQIKALTIQDNRIVVDLVTHGPKDPSCCPTVEVVQTYQLQGEALVLLSIVQKPTIRLEATTAVSPTLKTK